MNVFIRKEPVQADVLIIGGGISGLQAAIAAGEKGCQVVIAEKADTLQLLVHFLLKFRLLSFY